MRCDARPLFLPRSSSSGGAPQLWLDPRCCIMMFSSSSSSPPDDDYFLKNGFNVDSQAQRSTLEWLAGWPKVVGSGGREPKTSEMRSK